MFLKNLISEYSSVPEADLAEYIAREAFSTACKNTDNHGRNFSFLKTAGDIRISPIYDMAPMAWDTEGISRSTHWKNTEKKWCAEINELVKNGRISENLFNAELKKRTDGLMESWSLLEKTELKEIYHKYKVKETDWYEGLRQLNFKLE